MVADMNIDVVANMDDDVAAYMDDGGTTFPAHSP